MISLTPTYSNSFLYTSMAAVFAKAMGHRYMLQLDGDALVVGSKVDLVKLMQEKHAAVASLGDFSYQRSDHMVGFPELTAFW